MTDLHHTGQPDQLRFIDFIAAQQFDIVAKVAEEPIELPEGFGIAKQAAGNDVAGKSARLQNGQSKQCNKVSGLVGETELSAPGPETVHREFGRQHSDRRRGVLQSDVSCYTFLLDDVTVELAEQRVPIFLGAVGQANDKVFDLLARGIAQSLDSTEISCI